MPGLRLVCVNCPLVPQLRALGHSCLDLSLEPGIHEIQSMLPDLGQNMDAFIQVEALGRRVILKGLENLCSPTIFWARDPHLNAHWQTPYARLFDLVCSTQNRWAEHFKACGARHTAWLTWSGVQAPAIPWSQRTRDLAFVGVVNDERPTRRNMCNFMQKHYGMTSTQGVSRKHMLDIYGQSRMVPNESIFGEVNMRLFEAASCGCAVLTQANEEDTAALFEPEREILVFDHVLELKHRLDRLLKNPGAAEKMGKLARARVQAEHLPRHRAEHLARLAAEIQKTTPDGTLFAEDFRLSVYRLAQTGCLLMPWQSLINELAGRAEHSSAMLAAWMGAVYAAGRHKELEAALTRLAARPPAPNFSLYSACSTAALALNHFQLAKIFWQKHVDTEKNSKPPLPPRSPEALLLDWAKIHHRHGLISRPGFVFDAGRHLPETALECLLQAASISPSPGPVFDRIQNLLRRFRGYNEFRLRTLSWIGLRRRKDWKLGLDLGMTNLRNFRLEQGMEELILALEWARRQGQENYFFKYLKTADPSGLIRKKLILALAT